MKPRWQESKTASHPTVKRRGNEHVHLYCVNSLLHSDSSGSKAKNSTTNYLLGSPMPIKDNFLTINILEDIHLSLTLFDHSRLCQMDNNIYAKHKDQQQLACALGCRRIVNEEGGIL